MKTNCFPLELPFQEFQIQRIAFQEGLIDKLRDQYNETHSFFRRSDFIYISPAEVDAEVIGDYVTLSIKDSSDVVSSLIRHVFFRTFRKEHPDITGSFYPFAFPSRREQHNLIKDLLPEKYQEVISYKKYNEISIKEMEPVLGSKIFSAVIDSYFRWDINWKCNVLVQKGFDIRGLEVARVIFSKSSASVVAPELRSIGRVKSVSPQSADIDTNEGLLKIPLEELALRNTKENLVLLLGYFVGDRKAESIYKTVKDREVGSYKYDSVLKEINAIGVHLANLDYKNGDGFSFSVQPNDDKLFSSIEINDPAYIFDISLSKVDKSPSSGLNKFGPYDRLTFEISSPKVLVVCHKHNAGGFSEFLGHLKNGLPNSPYFPSGFLTKYKLRNIEFVFLEVSQYDIAEYTSKISQVLSENNEKAFDLAIVETSEEFKSRPLENNPYYHSKALLLTKGIPVQFLKAENARRPEYIIDSVALQMYAKLGGTPWTIPASQNVAHEIIVGVGHSIHRTNTYSGAEKNRLVGISTFFSSDGKYLVGNKTKDVEYEAYFNELQRSLETSIDQLSKSLGWNDGDLVRIIFHVFKPMKNLELDVVMKIVNNYSRYNIKFAFVSFSEGHPYLLFEPKQPGIQQRNGSLKGTFVPSRGANVVISPYSCLVQMKGAKEMKSDRQSSSKPLLINIHPNSTFIDLNSIVQQVFRFTNLSYRTFMPAQLPVTLLYSNLISEQLIHLRKIPNWNSDLVNLQLQSKKWFL